MSEQHRTRLYAWLCEQTDEPLAEYLMACLAPAPLSDLATKEYLSAVLSRFATEEDMNAGFDALRSEIAAQRAEDRTAFAAQRAEDRTAFAAQRAEDREAFAAQITEIGRNAQYRHYWLTGTVISVGLSMGAPIWLNTLGIIG